jgi:choline dehydrogenase-like flavoprotein
VTHTIIVGSGPAAAGASLALARDASHRITVVDVGHRLEGEAAAAVDRMALETPAQWDSDDLELIRAQPKDVVVKGLPEKRSYGSDFPFRDVGQRTGLTGIDQVNTAVISGAYGGLSNVWGSQVMPFTPATFRQWPVSVAEMELHYRSILREIPFAGEADALSEHFPLIGPASPLPPLAPRTLSVIAAADRHRNALRRNGVVVGRARLAFDSPRCVRCGLCMTGCPYSLIYSSASTFDRLRREGRVEYRAGLLAVRLGEESSRPYVIVRDLAGGGTQRLDADRVLVACGAVGTTRLVLGSLGVFGEDIELAESAQFVLPMVSMRPVPDPRYVDEFTLNQFNMVVSTDDEWLHVTQIHFYPHNPAIMEALPSRVSSFAGGALVRPILRRLTIGLGYLPSWASAPLRVRAERAEHSDDLPRLVVQGSATEWTRTSMFRKVLGRVLRAAPMLDLWPVLPMMFMSVAGKSYHFGGSFPHRTDAVDGVLTTDRLGRLDAWDRIHLVDASVFPTVPATTFTLTIMANAHRIATEVIGAPE